MGHHREDFLVRPLDTVWFRGPQPFVAGEDSVDLGTFPPNPRSFQGLVRSRLLLAALPGDLDAVDRTVIGDLVGPPDRLPAGWRLEGPFPASAGANARVEPWFVTPSFLLDGRGRGEPVRARPAPDLATLTDLAPGRVLLGQPRFETERLHGWITGANLRWALTGAGAWDLRGYRPDLPPFVAVEIRPGIRIERDTRTAADHMLYVATHHRFRPGSGLLGRLTAESERRIPDGALVRGWGQVGRMGRLVEFEGPVEVERHWSLLRSGGHLRPSRGSEGIPDPVLAWVVLLTLAVAEDGDPPFEFPQSAVRVRVIGSLANAGPDLGGFDRAAGGGRPVRATWAAGSAWLMELSGGSENARLDAARALQGLEPHASSPQEQMGLAQRVVGLFHPETLLPIDGGSHD
jgi:hypothetical protein